jgi:2,3-bisphosphoglycerate-dependent phosphoglycerate mutase
VAHSYQAPFTLSEGATEVVLVRHGASDQSLPVSGMPLVGGQRDPPLTPHGHRQAEAVARRLGVEPVSRLFITRFQRTAQTAAPLSRRLGLEPVVVAELGEVHLGEWELSGGLEGGGPERDALRQRVLDEESWGVVPGGEGMTSFARRVDRGLNLVADAAGANQVAVAVCHGGVVAQACHAITGSRPFAFFAVQTGSISRVVRTADGRWLLRAFNDVAHQAGLA